MAHTEGNNVVATGRDVIPLHVIVQGKHIDVTPALRTYAETKVSRLTRYFDQSKTLKLC